MKKTSLHFLWKDYTVPGRFDAAVSLHSHTCHSWENLRFLDSFKLPLPLISTVLRGVAWHHRRVTGQALSIARVRWTPPLAPEEAQSLEVRQIRKLGLHALVSLTDHDDIQSGLSLGQGAPVSLEWTIPVGTTFFHVGVHNLPAGAAHAIAADLYDYTAHPSADRLAALLEMLHGHENVLIVLNHPLWDEADIGAEAHRQELSMLLSRYKSWIHALELNGLRSWEENIEVLSWARDWRLPPISGGDRHGLEPNANLNLTEARTFDEFAGEIRREGLSRMLFMPQYREPLRLRWFATVRHIVGRHAGVRQGRWVDRFFYECDDGVVRPIAELWPNEGPALLRSFFAMLCISESPSLRAFLRMTRSDPAEMLA